MIWYYWESKTSFGQFKASSDEEAKEKVSRFSSKSFLYRESETEDGTPFVVILDELEENRL